MLCLLGLSVWFTSHLYFGSKKKTAGLSRFGVFILQAFTIWGTHAIALVLISVYSDQVKNLGFLFFPLFVSALVLSVCGPLLTLALGRRQATA